jgi:hypothetical protein
MLAILADVLPGILADVLPGIFIQAMQPLIQLELRRGIRPLKLMSIKVRYILRRIFSFCWLWTQMSYRYTIATAGLENVNHMKLFRFSIMIMALKPSLRS